MESTVAERSEVVQDEAGRVPEYVCVDYPANVVNVENMLNTLGGLGMISHVYSDPNRRLELRFRPSDVYCKPTCATRESSTGLLVRVRKRVKRKKKTPSRESSAAADTSGGVQPAERTEGASSEQPSEEYCSTLLGVVRTSYAFNTLCDYQYLPLMPVQNTSSPSGHDEDHPRPVPVSKISRDGASASQPAAERSVPTSTTAASAASRAKGAKSGLTIACEGDTAVSECPTAAELHSSAEVSSGKLLTSTELPSSAEELPAAEQSPSEISTSPSVGGKSVGDPKRDLNPETGFPSSTDSSERPEEPNSERGLAHPYECFTPQELVSTEWLRKEPQFLFLPPPAFTRMDTPQAYFFRGEESESSRPQAVPASAASKSSVPASSAPSTTGPKIDDCASSSSATCPSTAAAAGTSDANTESSRAMASPSVRPTPNVIYRTRQRRTLFAVLCDFDAPTPCEPHPEALKQLRLKFLQRSISPVYERLRQLFEERPIWSRAGVRSALGYRSDNLKYLLPTLGYYFTAGPWRNLWIKFGYDPRKKPESFVYQTFNYRLKQSGLIKSYIDAKRNYSSYLLPYKSNFVSRRKVSVIQSNLLPSSSLGSKGITGDNAKKSSSLTKKSISDSASPSSPCGSSCKDPTAADDSEDVTAAEEEEAERDDGDEGDYSLLDPDCEQNAFSDLDGGESSVGDGGESVGIDAEREGSSSTAEECLREENYIYRPGCIPPYRQMFYQYCDMLVPEIQQVLESCVLETSERLRCDLRYGWLNRRVEDECRSIMGRVVDAAVRKRTAQEREQQSKAATSTSASPTDASS